MAAIEAKPEMDPFVAHLQALLAAIGSARRDLLQIIEVMAFIHTPLSFRDSHNLDMPQAIQGWPEGKKNRWAMFPLLLVPGILLASLFLSGCSGESSSSTGEDDTTPRPSETPTFQPTLLQRISEPPLRYVGPRPCPESMAQVASVCIDRYEAHLVVDKQVHPHSHRPPTAEVFKAATAPDVWPQAYIGKFEAAEACHQSNKRLCSLDEWLRACKGSLGFLYSYGTQEEKGRCNTGKPHLMMQLFKDKPTIAWTYEDFNDPTLDETPGFLAKSAEYFSCVNDYGIFDMVGNLHEWVADVVDRDLPNRIHLNPALANRYAELGGFGIFMGGFYSTSHEHGSGCEFITIGHEEAYHDYSTGFRCCKDAANE